MKKAFTLIELIFVIVIIGLLSAVAVPKFLNLKQSAQANSVIKTTVDTVQEAVNTAVNQLDLENKTDVNLSDIVTLKGKGWTCQDDVNASTTETIDRCRYVDPAETNASKYVVEINFSTNPREVNYSIDCTKFVDSTTSQKCRSLLSNNSTTSVNLTY